MRHGAPPGLNPAQAAWLSVVGMKIMLEIGTHHHIAGPCLSAYSAEASWREDNRRVTNGDQAMMVGAAALASRQSRTWAGYWQRG